MSIKSSISCAAAERSQPAPLSPHPAAATTSLCPDTRVTSVQAQRAAAQIHRQVHKERGLFSSQRASFCYVIVPCVVPGWILRAKQHPRAAEGALAGLRTQHSHHQSTLFYTAWWNFDPQTYPKNSRAQNFVMTLSTKTFPSRGSCYLIDWKQSWKAGHLQLSSVPDCRDVITPSSNHQYLSSPWKWPFSSLCSRYLCNMGHWTLMSYKLTKCWKNTACVLSTDRWTCVIREMEIRTAQSGCSRRCFGCPAQGQAQDTGSEVPCQTPPAPAGEKMTLGRQLFQQGGKEGGVGTPGSAGVAWTRACHLKHTQQFTSLSYSLAVLQCFSSGIWLGWLEARSGCQFWRRRMNIMPIWQWYQTQPVCACLLCLHNTPTLYIQAPLRKVFQHEQLVGSATDRDFQGKWLSPRQQGLMGNYEGFNKGRWEAVRKQPRREERKKSKLGH